MKTDVVPGLMSDPSGSLAIGYTGKSAESLGTAGPTFLMRVVA